MICANQQVKLKEVFINTTNLEKINKTHSLQLLITKIRTNFARYDLLAGFMIIKCTNFTTRELEVDSSTGEAIIYDLFRDYCRVTVQDVANSCQWYVQFTPTTMQMRKGMNWLMQYFKNNVNPTVFAHCHAQYMLFPVNQRGGPLFLKIHTNHLTASDKRTKESLLKSVKAYKITTIDAKNIRTAYN